MERIDELKLFKNILTSIKKNDIEVIELSIMEYCLHAYNKTLLDYSIENKLVSSSIMKKLSQLKFPTDIITVMNFFEFLVDKKIKDINGMVFTPKYISDYIIQNIFKDIDHWSSNIKVVDPGSGCGVFLLSAIEFIHEKFNIEITDIIKDNIFAMDINADNVRRYRYIVILFCAIHNVNFDVDIINCSCVDSLKYNWSEYWNISGFDYIIGNPPYVNPHILNKETIDFLKDSFVTTRSGVFNIFYAFIEHGMKNLNINGKLGYIVPNNFFTIKSAKELRHFLSSNRYIEKILDLGENMVFSPIRTYNCIIFLNKKEKQKLEFALMTKENFIKNSFSDISFMNIKLDNLNDNGWKLVDNNVQYNLDKIENQYIHLKELIRTGIATLRDRVYLVEKDDIGFYKIINGEKFYIESDLVKSIYKISDLKKDLDYRSLKKHIIFPYIKSEGKYELINEVEFQQKYPCAYNCLLKNKATLDKRDKGNGNQKQWYAYGRTQGLNKYGNKLLFPTFSKYPKFIKIMEEDALFCNGYAVFENDIVELDILSKILNSKVMDYYIKNTSYSIEGGYYCYQKKYIENFSIPKLTLREKNFIKKADHEEIDKFLLEKYQLVI